jgi:hypothetical protein
MSAERQESVCASRGETTVRVYQMREKGQPSETRDREEAQT